MLGVRWHARGDVRLDEIPEPSGPPPGEVRLRVLYCGICGTDVEEMNDGPLFLPVGAPHPLTGARTPLVLGHEFSGEVVALGEGVTELAIGDVVGVDGNISCGRCEPCLAGLPNLCVRYAQLGLSRDGGLAELVNAPAHTVVRVPAGAPAEIGALAETLSVGVRALRKVRVGQGDRVAVLGAGAVGLLAGQAARAAGAREVVMVERLAVRRAVAGKLELTAVDPADLASDAFDVVLECSGAPAALGTAVDAARPTGRVALVGFAGEPAALDVLAVVRKELELVGSMSHVLALDFTAAIDLLAGGAVVFEPLVSDRVPLERALDDGLRALAEHPADHLKILVTPATHPRANI